MNKFILVFAACIVLLLILLVVIPLTLSDRPDDSENYVDENGNHKYYERSLIKKQNYFRENPNETQREIRSIKKLLKKIFFLKK